MNKSEEYVKVHDLAAYILYRVQRLTKFVRVWAKLAGWKMAERIKRLRAGREDRVNVHGMFTSSYDVHAYFT